MIKIKVNTDFPHWPLVRQTPRCEGIWRGCQFTVNQPDEDCDCFVVIHNLLAKERVMCRRENTLLITGEPPQVWRYDRRFAGQFGTVITCDNGLRHPHVTRSQQGLPWMIGGSWDSALEKWNDEFKYSFDQLINSVERPEKTGVLSVITSDKEVTVGHRDRKKFVERLKAHFGDRIEVYGRGVRDVSDKWDAIAPYKYHISIENSCVRDYWTEKLSDAFLADAYPLYVGCPNISDYFPNSALAQMSLAHFDAAVETIERTIALNRYEESVDVRAECRRLVLEQYNVFNVIANHALALRLGRALEPVQFMPQQHYTNQIGPRIVRKGRTILESLSGSQ